MTDIDTYGTDIGQTILTAEHAATATRSATSALSASCSTTHGIEVKQRGIDVIEVTQNGNLCFIGHTHPHGCGLVPILRTITGTQGRHITLVVFRVDLNIDDFFGIAGFIAGHIGHIAIIVDNLDFLDDIRR